MFFKRVLVACSIMVFLYLAFPPLAHAYLDPGTGSYIFQLIIASLVGVGLVIKLYWKKIKSFFLNLTSRKRNTDKDEDQI